MKQVLTFVALFAANALQPLPLLSGIGITLFSGLFIFTVMTAKSQWKPSPILMEHIQNVCNLMATLILFAATAVILVAVAAIGPDISFPDALLMVIQSLPRMLDV